MRFFSLKTRIVLGEGSLSHIKSVARKHSRVLIFSSKSIRGFLNEAMDYVEDANAEVEAITG
ncbi:MAG TPA: NAD-dependent alcohol dehydrogenase, partial [Thermococcus paralvinellae]|nr:NAD-dependent alcohol dehydrogenase [Thermococcus paralvinellae]